MLRLNNKKIWEKLNRSNKEYLAIFLTNKGNIKRQSLIQYESAIKSFLLWNYINCNNKNINEITTEDIILYQTYLINEKKLTPKSVLFKRNSISTFFTFLYKYFPDTFNNLQNVFNDVPVPSNKEYIEKEHLTRKEFNFLCKTLEYENKFLPLIYLRIQFNNGLKLKQLQDLKREIIYINKNQFGIYPVFIKGRVTPISIDEKTMELLKETLKKRKDNNGYIFVSNIEGVISRLNITTFNFWCKSIFSKMIKREIKHSMVYKNKTNR